jgi:hypothetical protein
MSSSLPEVFPAHRTKSVGGRVPVGGYQINNIFLSVSVSSKSLRRGVPLLGFCQLRSELLAGRHTKTVKATS